MIDQQLWILGHLFFYNSLRDKYLEGDTFPVPEIQKKTSPKGFSASKCDVENWIFSKSWEFFGNSLGILGWQV